MSTRHVVKISQSRLSRYVRNRHKWLRLLVVAAFFLWIIINFILSSYGNVFPKADKVAGLFSRLCEAIIAGWVLYLIVTRWKEKVDEENTAPYIKTKVLNLIVMHQDILSIIPDRVGIHTGTYPIATDEEISLWFSRVSTAGRDEVENLRTILKNCMREAIAWHNLLYKLAYHLDSELLLLMTAVEDSKFAHGDVLMEDSFLQYHRTMLKVRDYYEKRFGTIDEREDTVSPMIEI